MQNEIVEGAQAIAAMPVHVRENTETQDMPGGHQAYLLFAAQQLLPRPSDKLKKINGNRSYGEGMLYNNFHYIANVDGVLFGVTRQEDPDESDDETKFIYSFERIDDSTHKLHDTITSDVAELFTEIRKTLQHNNPETGEAEDMMVPMNLSPVSLRDRNSGKVYTFKPEGPVEVHVDEQGAADAGVDVNDLIETARRITASRSSNPVAERVTRPSQGARLLIGFNVGTEKVWTVDGVLNLAFWYRRQQVVKAFKEGYATPSPVGGDLGMTFLIQKGVWQTAGDKKSYPEDGTSLILLNTINEDPAHFEQDMEALAEELATRLKQQAIIIEHQSRGVVESTVTMLPR